MMTHGFLVESIHDEHRYYAKRLHKALDGLGTDDVTLMRVIVGRAEIDLGCIKDVYEEMYHETLASAVIVCKLAERVGATKISFFAL